MEVERKTILDRLFDSGPMLLIPILIFVVWLVLVVVFASSKNKPNINLLMPIMMIPPCLVAGSALYGFFGEMMSVDSIGSAHGGMPFGYFSNIYLVAFGGRIVAFLGIISTIGSWILFFSSFRKIATSLVNTQS